MAGSEKVLRVVGWVWPIPALPLFFWLILEGVSNLGGGEKDILAIIPATFYALLYWIFYFVWLRRRIPAGRAILFALASGAAAYLIIGFAFAAYLRIKL